MKILGAVMELPAKQLCQSRPFTSKLGKIGQIGSVVQLVAPNGSKDFAFFNSHGCRLFILCEIRCYFCPYIFWVYYFSLSQCVLVLAQWSPPSTKDTELALKTSEYVLGYIRNIVLKSLTTPSFIKRRYKVPFLSNFTLM